MLGEAQQTELCAQGIDPTVAIDGNVAQGVLKG
jgi:hypothetical protein